MAPTKKSIYRAPGAQHFQLVHRSVRDPLINDPEASQQVFKSVDRLNAGGKHGVRMAWREIGGGGHTVVSRDTRLTPRDPRSRRWPSWR